MRVEAAFELRGAFWTGLALVGLEVGVEPPDQLTGDVEGAALVIIEADQLVHRPLGMNPAESMLASSELAGVIAQDHGALEVAMGVNAAPRGAFGGDLDRVGVDLEPADALPIEMGGAGRPIGGALGVSAFEPGDHRAGRVVPAHGGQGLTIDHIVVVGGAQQLEKIPPALGEGGGEEGEAVPVDQGRSGW